MFFSELSDDAFMR